MEIEQLLVELFVVQHDNYTIQRRGGKGYVRRGSPTVPRMYQALPSEVTPELLGLHLHGHVTIGVYSQSGDRAKWLCFDDDRGLDRLHQIKGFLKEQFLISSYIEKSRRGGHLWIFCEEPVEARKLRRLAKHTTEKLELDDEALDIFPTRDDVCEGFGQAVRLPWGVHQATGEVYLFEDIPGGTPAAQIRWLEENVYRLPTQRLDQIITVIQPVEELTAPEVGSKELRPVTGSYVDQIKARLPIIELADKITDLRPSDGGRGRYYLGKCPFHPDKHPSFWLDAELGLANCFRPDCGGEKPMDVINLYARYHNITNRQAIFDLCDELGITPVDPKTVAKVPGLHIEEPEDGDGGEQLDAVREAYQEWLDKLYGDPSSRGKVYLVNLPGGAGKTHGALAVAQRHPDLRFHIVLGMKKTREELQAKGLLEGFSHIDGRAQVNCSQYRKAEILGRKGYSIKHSLCFAGCEDRHSCAYLASWNSVGSSNVTFMHEHLITDSIWDCDILIVDEDFIKDACLREWVITAGMLQSQSERVKEELKSRVLGEDPLKQLLKVMAAALDEVPKGGTKDIYGILDAKLQGGLYGQVKKAHRRFERWWRGLPVVSASEMTLKELERLPPRFLPDLLDTMRQEVVRMRSSPHLTNSRLSLGKTSQGGWCYVLQCHRSLGDLTADVQQLPTILILDAASEPSYYERVLGVEIAEVFSREIRLPENVEVWQVTSALCGKTGLESQPAAREAAIKKIDFLLALSGSLDKERALITFQGVEEEIATAIDAETSLHFFGLRGIGEIESLDIPVLIVYGTPSPPPWQVLRQALALHGDEEPIDPGATKVDRIWVPDDERVRQQLHSMRSRELYQACFRIRPLSASDFPKTIIIFSPLEIPHLKPTHVITKLPRGGTMRGFVDVARVVRELKGKQWITVVKVARLADCDPSTAKRYMDALRRNPGGH